MPFSYALAALLASAPVMGFVMSTPASLPPAQAHSANRTRALAVVALICAFPIEPQRLRRRGRRVSLRDQRPEMAPLLPRVGGFPAPQAPLQRARGQLFLAHALRRFPGGGLDFALRDPLRCELPRDQARSISQRHPRFRPRARRLAVVD